MQHIPRTFVVLSTVAACIIGGVADARAQVLETVSARALQQCATPYADHGVSETTIVYGIDRVVPDDDLFLPMDVERNTAAYRQQAFTFFAERFGVRFDIARTDDQEETDAAGRSAVMRPIRLTRGASHQVYAIDDQDIARINGALVGAGVEVSGLAKKKTDLEDLFMKLANAEGGVPQ